MPVEFAIRGFDEINRNLKALTGKEVVKGLDMAVRKAAMLVVKTARSKVPSKSKKRGTAGLLKKSIKLKRTEKSIRQIRYTVGWDTKVAPYGHLVELGHKIVPRIKGGKSNIGGAAIGTVAPRPHLRPAFEGTQNKQFKIMQVTLWEAIRKAMKVRKAA